MHGASHGDKGHYCFNLNYFRKEQVHTPVAEEMLGRKESERERGTNLSRGWRLQLVRIDAVFSDTLVRLFLIPLKVEIYNKIEM